MYLFKHILSESAVFLWLWSWAPLLSLSVIYIFALLGRTDSRQAHRRRIWDGTWDTLAPDQNNWRLSSADGHTGGLTGGEGRGGGVLCQFCVLLGVCARVCVCLHTVTSGPWSTDMSDKGFINEATLHPSGCLQHHTAKTATDLMSLRRFQCLNPLLYLYSKYFVSYCYLPSTTGKSEFSSLNQQIHKIVGKVKHEPPHRTRHKYNY